MSRRLFVCIRDAWVGLNAAAFVLAVWYTNLPPMEGTHPGYLAAMVWIVLLFPGVFVMIPTFFLLEWAIPAWVFQRVGTMIFFTVWLGGAGVIYAFWFILIPRWRSSRRRQ